MTDQQQTTAAGHAQAMDEARTLLSAGLVSELIQNTHRIADATALFAQELREDREARAVEVRSLRRRNGAFAVALSMAVILLAAVTFIGGGRLTNIAQANKTSLQEQTDGFLDAAFCVAEHGFQNEQTVRLCYEQRRAAQRRLIDGENATHN